MAENNQGTFGPIDLCPVRCQMAIGNQGLPDDFLNSWFGTVTTKTQ